MLCSLKWWILGLEWYNSCNAHSLTNIILYFLVWILPRFSWFEVKYKLDQNLGKKRVKLITFHFQFELSRVFLAVTLKHKSIEYSFKHQRKKSARKFKHWNFLKHTWSLGCTGLLEPNSPPKISIARFAMTSLVFILLWVPDPVCQMTKNGQKRLKNWQKLAKIVKSCSNCQRNGSKIVTVSEKW